MYYLFGEYVLDLHRHELRHADAVIPLERKVYQVFVYLVQHRDRLVSQAELLEQLWPGVYVDSSAIARCIGTIRRAVGDTSESQQVIRTRRGQGYHFVAAVTEQSAPETVEPVERASAQVSPAPSPVALTFDPPGGRALDAPGTALPAATTTEVGWPCSTCHHLPPAGAQFCPVCGSPLTASCPHCGQYIRLPSTFCSACGRPLLPGFASAPVETLATVAPQLHRDTPPPGLPLTTGEHKLITALCGLLMPDVDLETHLGLDGLHDFLHDMEQLLLQVLQPYGGTLYELGHQRLIALFGAPEAQEDHATRALLAALALHRQWGQLRSGSAAEVLPLLPLHIGLHSGPVVVREARREQPHALTIVGDVPALAATMARQGSPGMLVVSEPTARLLREVVYLEAMPPVPGSAPGTSLAAFRVGEGIRPPHRQVAAEHLHSCFVGRQEELALLHRRLERCCAGQGQVVSIIGEPGIGKSRLLEEFRQSLGEHSVTYLTGHCQSYGQATPYLPLTELLQQLCGLSSQEDIPVRLGKVQAWLHSLGLQCEDSVVAPLLGIPFITTDINTGNPQGRKAQTLKLLHHLFGQYSQQQPLVLVVENLHWIDPTSEAFLAELVERVIGVSILLVSTARPGYRPPWMPMSHVTQVALPSLTEPASRQVVQARLARQTLPAAVSEHIVTRAQGNPFFLEELAQMVLEHGMDALHAAVPTTVQAVLAARMDRLPAAAKALLHLAAVLGKASPIAWLEELAGLHAAMLQQQLQHLQRAEFLYVTHLAPLPLVTFKHTLTQEVAYHALLSRTRRQVHAQIAQMLIKRFPESIHNSPELLAHHYSEAGDPERAMPYWQEAGQRALERGAMAEASTHLHKGLALLKTLPPSPQQARQELMGQLSLGAALTATKGYTAAEVGQTYARAWQLSQQFQEAATLNPALAGLWRYYAARGELRRAQELGEQGLTLAQANQDTIMRLFTHMSLGITQLYRGEVAAALAHCEHSLALYNAATRSPLNALFPQDAGVACHAFAAQALWLLGYPEQALARCQHSLSLAQQLNSPFNLAYALNLTLVVHQLRREGAVAYQRAEEAMAFCTSHGFTQLLAMATILRGWARAAEGQGEAGTADMRQGLAANPAGSGLGQPPVLAQLAEAYLQTGQLEEGLGALDNALTIMAQTDERWWAAEVYRLRGEVLLALAPRQQPQDALPTAHAAEENLQQALAIARQQQARSLELRAATSLSRLWQAQGKHEMARTLLAEVYAWFTEGFETADLQEAKALLAALV